MISIDFKLEMLRNYSINMSIFPYFGLTNSFNIEGVEDSIRLFPRCQI